MKAPEAGRMMVHAERPLVTQAREASPKAVGESALVARARDGDTAAFDALVAIHLKQVYRITYRLCWNHDDAQDIVQDAFVRAFDRLRSLRSDADFAPWLYRIAVNRSLTHRGRQERAGLVESRAEPPVRLCDDPQARAEASALSARVREEIRRLPKRQRAAVALYALEGWSIEETAQAMGCSAGTVKRHLHRAKATLRKRLPDLQGDEGSERC